MDFPIFFCSFKQPPHPHPWAYQVALVIKNPPANAGNVRDMGSIPGSGRSPGGGDGNTLQYSCLENPMDRGAWRARVHVLQRVRHDLNDLACHFTHLPPTHPDPQGAPAAVRRKYLLTKIICCGSLPWAVSTLGKDLIRIMTDVSE